MSKQNEFRVGAQVWARMIDPPNEGQPAAHSDTEVLSWVVAHERRGNVLYYCCKSPESGGIWTRNVNEIVSGLLDVRPTYTYGAQFELNQIVHIKKRVEWEMNDGDNIQKSGRVVAGWCKQARGNDGTLMLDYSYWIEVGSADTLVRNWYPQQDLEQ